MKKEALITLAKDQTLVFEIQELYVSSTFFLPHPWWFIWVNLFIWKLTINN